jgi:hypothetical protein
MKRKECKEGKAGQEKERKDKAMQSRTGQVKDGTGQARDGTGRGKVGGGRGRNSLFYLVRKGKGRDTRGRNKRQGERLKKRREWNGRNRRKGRQARKEQALPLTRLRCLPRGRGR